MVNLKVATLEDLRARYEIQDLQVSCVEIALSDAHDFILSYIDLEEVHEDYLKRVCVDIAMYFLSENSPMLNTSITKRYEDAVKFLERTRQKSNCIFWKSNQPVQSRIRV